MTSKISTINGMPGGTVFNLSAKLFIMLDKEYIIEKPFTDENGDVYLVKVSTNLEDDQVYYIVDLHDTVSKELVETFTLQNKNDHWIEKEGKATTAAIKYGTFITENL